MATVRPDIPMLDDDEPIPRHRRGDPRAPDQQAPTTDRTLRWGAAVLLIVISVVHLHLWLGGYRYLATIGPLFLLDVIFAALLAVVVAVRRSLVVAIGAASLAGGTLGANVLSLLLPKGLFRFREIGVSYSGAFAIASEVGVVVLLATWAYLGWRRGDLMAPRRRSVPSQTSRDEPTFWDEPAFRKAPEAPRRDSLTPEADITPLRISNPVHGSRRASATTELTQRKERTR
jgi:hypothetical protein